MRRNTRAQMTTEAGSLCVVQLEGNLRTHRGSRIRRSNSVLLERLAVESARTFFDVTLEKELSHSNLILPRL